jgi:hypothetical protein
MNRGMRKEQEKINSVQLQKGGSVIVLVVIQVEVVGL